MKRVIFISALLCGVVSGFGQYRITGVVKSEDDGALQGATVVLKETKQGVATDADGHFDIGRLDNRHYTLQVAFLGYDTQELTVKAGNRIEIELKKSSIRLDELTVVSNRADERSAVAYSNVDADDLAQRNLGQDMPYLLSLTPSFVATSDAGAGIGYTSFRIRGADANRINVTVNGVPYNDAESHGSFFVNIPDLASSLSSVQVQRGVGTSVNGAPAFGASVNMETEHVALQPFGEIGTSVGSFNTGKYTVKAGTGKLNNKLAFDGRVSGIRSDGYVDRAFSSMQSYLFSAGYYGEHTALKLLSFGGKEKTYQAWNGVDLDLVRRYPLEYQRTYNDIGRYVDDEGNVRFYDNQTDNYTQIHYQLHWTQRFTPFLYLNTTLHYTDGIGYYEDYKTDRKYEEYGLTPAVENGENRKKTDLIRQKWLENNFYGLVFSLNYDRNRLQTSLGGGVNQYLCDHRGEILWVRHPNNFDPDGQWYANNATKNDANLYLKLNLEIVRQLFATADLQYRVIHYAMFGKDDKYDDSTADMRDITQAHHFQFFNPKFGLVYRPTEQHRLYASFSVANREPNRNNYTDAGKDERPTSERLYDTEIGYQYISGRFAAGLNCYYMKYKDQLILTGKISDIGEPLTSNIPDSYRMGVEYTVGLKLSEQLRWDGNISLSRNKILNFTEKDIDVYDADWNWIDSRDNILGTTDIAYSPNIIANSRLTFEHKKFGISLYSAYVGRQYFDNTSDS
ncbi:MAG: TonB-dependent receptor, partial [Prevotellaceae bacterium]|nr:TonB-dependent receptor [Prevotellaceae bacterium]